MLGFSDIPDSQKTAEQLENSKSSLRFTGLEADELSDLTLYSHSVLLDDFLKKGKDRYREEILRLSEKLLQEKGEFTKL